MAIKKRVQLVEKFIDLLLIFRPYTIRDIPAPLFFPLLLAFMALRHFK